jgi:hypothetical protein
MVEEQLQTKNETSKSYENIYKWIKTQSRIVLKENSENPISTADVKK